MFLSPLAGESDGGYPFTGSKRPSWALMGKVNQNMETILFREKFLDWPESGKFVKRRTQEKTAVCFLILVLLFETKIEIFKI